MVIDSMFVYNFVNPDRRVVIIFRKKRTAENRGIDFEIVDRHLCTLALGHELIPFLAPLGEQNIIWIFSKLRVSTF